MIAIRDLNYSHVFTDGELGPRLISPRQHIIVQSKVRHEPNSTRNPGSQLCILQATLAQTMKLFWVHQLVCILVNTGKVS